jgi:hypothetical protein
MCQRRRARAG